MPTSDRHQTGYEHFPSEAALRDLESHLVEELVEHRSPYIAEDLVLLREEILRRQREPLGHQSLREHLRETLDYHIAWRRDEWEPCQKGTRGCCVDHDAVEGGMEQSCYTW